ncbi:MAG: type II toxin-antitoxin system HicA family toxin [Streptosporangiaceae bacterium]
MLLEGDGWKLKRVSGSHRQFLQPAKPGLVTVAGKPSATLKPKTGVKAALCPCPRKPPALPSSTRPQPEAPPGRAGRACGGTLHVVGPRKPG